MSLSLRILRAPKARQQKSPGQHPGNIASKIVPALKRRYKFGVDGDFLSLLQGFILFSCRIPRALPWATMFCPFGAEPGENEVAYRRHSLTFAIIRESNP